MRYLIAPFLPWLAFLHGKVFGINCLVYSWLLLVASCDDLGILCHQRLSRGSAPDKILSIRISDNQIWPRHQRKIP
jgi:hypothetical protein